ncbi:membrane protein containing Acyl-CoA dehydrogenase, partial [mine drainage metagenome]
MLIGASMGGLLGIAVAGDAQRPAPFSALALVDITPRWEAAGVARILDFMRAYPQGFADYDAAAVAVAAYLPQRGGRKGEERLRALLRRGADGRLRWHWDPALLDVVENEGRAQQQALLEATRRIRLPTLLVSGGLSDVVSATTVDEFMQLLPGAVHVNVPGATHTLVGDANDAFVAAIADFVRALAAHTCRGRVMTIVLIVLALLVLSLLLAFLRGNAALWSALSIVLAAAVGYAAGSAREALIAAIVLALLTLPFAIVPLRRALFSRSLLKAFAHALPRLSDTERTALDAGTVGFEAELFSGKPDWHKLLAEPRPALSAEEQAFMDGPVERLCAMLDDWRITHELADLPPEVWAFLKREKFFGMIIPKRYGGLEFSALAHSAVLQKVSSICPTASSTIAVPNSLGPAELLLHYGSEQQKDYYLPRLADGREIPCFALT